MNVWNVWKKAWKCKVSVLNVDARELLVVLRVLRDSSLLQCKLMLDIVCVDTGSSEMVLMLVLRSLRWNRQVIVKCRVEKDVALSSSSLFLCAEWLEREVCEMFGMSFEGNMDLRRLLLDYGFVGSPLRKDFVMSESLRFDEESKVVVPEKGVLPVVACLGHSRKHAL